MLYLRVVLTCADLHNGEAADPHFHSSSAGTAETGKLLPNAVLGKWKPADISWS
eukprot:COSAG04_NODE_25477_length_307_cov_0.552885_1_plen_53_part_10